MNDPDIEFAYPVDWPLGRNKEGGLKQALWKEDGRQLNFDQAVRRVREQVRAMTKAGQQWRVREMTLSTNFQLRADGRPRRDRGRPLDQAVAFFFELDGTPHVLACDRFDRIEDNIAAIAAHIEALRGQERWGVADMKQAFAGHAQLPAPEQWWQVLGVSKTPRYSVFVDGEFITEPTSHAEAQEQRLNLVAQEIIDLFDASAGGAA